MRLARALCRIRLPCRIRARGLRAQSQRQRHGHHAARRQPHDGVDVGDGDGRRHRVHVRRAVRDDHSYRGFPPAPTRSTSISPAQRRPPTRATSTLANVSAYTFLVYGATVERDRTAARGHGAGEHSDRKLRRQPRQHVADRRCHRPLPHGPGCRSRRGHTGRDGHGLWGRQRVRDRSARQATSCGSPAPERRK